MVDRLEGLGEALGDSLEGLPEGVRVADCVRVPVLKLNVRLTDLECEGLKVDDGTGVRVAVVVGV